MRKPKDPRTQLRRDVKYIIADLIEGALDVGLPLTDEAEQFGTTEDLLIQELRRQAEILYKKSGR